MAPSQQESALKYAALLLVVVATACKHDAETTTTSASASAASPAAPPAPFTGTLTGDRVMGSKDLVRPFQPWADAQAKLEAQMGKATLVKDGKMYMWGVSQGDDCWYVQVEKQADNTVGMVQDPMKVSKGGAIFNWDDCQLASGARKEVAEDPNAPGPPVGKTLSITDLHDGAIKARSKWEKAKVTVKGLFLNTTTGTANGTDFASISLVGTKGDSKNALGCQLSDPTTAPKKMLQYTPMTVTGTVTVSDMVSLAGNHSVDVGLKDCAIVK